MSRLFILGKTNYKHTSKRMATLLFVPFALEINNYQIYRTALIIA